MAAVNQNTPIQGTSYHARDAANTSKYQDNYGGFGNLTYYLNYSTASQDFLNSWADEYASWGVDFLKIDAIGDSINRMLRSGRTLCDRVDDRSYSISRISWIAILSISGGSILMPGALRVISSVIQTVPYSESTR